ncbi:hypothetical protein [Pseudoponticoccus marisrubri]|uniref:Uncharacterized protein n=1 Tax=Pseudoponticoccus marisrubri TaxID=1685382 RepID=A0A0W7WQA7_9RHOB|nr:hypothetical protein [Pseudoponticoccus marisrubri]KUF12762.1 hypothetical protein AVJ23_03365 [Pseudoponticoccus marisrubri]
MSKLIAILNVVAWAGFWAFGYLAATTPPEEGSRMVVALLLAATGAALGIWAYLWIVRHTVAAGHPRATRSRPRFEADAGLET